MFKGRNSGQSNKYSYRNIHDFTSLNGCNYPYKDLKKTKGFTTESIYAHVFFRIST